MVLQCISLLKSLSISMKAKFLKKKSQEKLRFKWKMLRMMKSLNLNLKKS